MAVDFIPIEGNPFEPKAAAPPAPPPEPTLTPVDGDPFGPPQSNIPPSFMDRFRRRMQVQQQIEDATAVQTEARRRAQGAGFVEALKQGFGEDRLGFSDEHIQQLQQVGIYRDPVTGRGGMLRLANEAIMQPASVLGDAILRSVNAGIYGLGAMAGAAAEETGLAEPKAVQKEVVNFLQYELMRGDKAFGRLGHDPASGKMSDQTIGTLPKEADFRAAAEALHLPPDGAPSEIIRKSIYTNLRRMWEEDGIHPAEAVHDAQRDAFLRKLLHELDPEPRDTSNIPPATSSPVPIGTPRAELARVPGDDHLNAILDSAPTRQVIDNPTVNRDFDVPYTAGGSVPLEDPTIFIDRHFPRSFTIDGVTFDPADPFAIHENLEHHVMEMLRRGGMDDALAYKIAHWEFAEKAEGQWYKSHGIDQAKAEAAYQPYMEAIQKEKAENLPPNLYPRPYPHDQPSAAAHEAFAEAKPTPSEVAQARAILSEQLIAGELRRLGVEAPPTLFEPFGSTTGIPAGVAKASVEADQVKAAETAAKATGNTTIIRRYATEAEEADLRAMIERKAPAEEIESHASIKRANADVESRPKTESLPGYGTPEFEAAREFNLDGKPARGYEAAINWLIAKGRSYSKDKPVGQDRRAVIVIGPPAAGKSHFAETLATRLRMAINDADDAKMILPEYDGGAGAVATHIESTKLAQATLEREIAQGTNLVLPKVGGKLGQIHDMVAQLQNRGYEVNLVNMSIDPAEAYRRMISRFMDTGRLISREFLEWVDSKPERNYHIFKGEGAFHETLEIDANGPRGTAYAKDGAETDLARVLQLGRGGGEGPAARLGVRGTQAEVRPLVAGNPLPNSVAAFRPDELTVDAKRFQFKADSDEAGVTERLKGVTRWDPVKAGMVLVWQDKTGKNFIIDGHQRLGLARRIEAADPSQQPQLLARVLCEAEGVTDAEARVTAALRNIAEGTGTAVDAAKVLRDNPERAAELPPRSELYRQARDLTNLSPDAFGMVINGVVPPHYAAVVGRLVPADPELQSAMLTLLARTDPANAIQAEAIVRQGIEAGVAKRQAGAQAGLFGEEEVAESLYVERAKVLDRALKEIKKDKAVFSVLTKEQTEIEAAGNRLAATVNEKRAAADAQAIQLLQVLANRAGPISDALGTAARAVRDTGKLGPAVRDFVGHLRSLLEEDQLVRIASRVERGPLHVGDEARTATLDKAAELESPQAAAIAAEQISDLIQPHALGAAATEEVQLARGKGAQFVLPGAERSARQAAAARGETLRAKVPQEEPGGMFAAPEPEEPTLFPLGAAVSPSPAQPSLFQQPAPPPGRIVAAITNAGEQLLDIGRDIQMLATPMAVGGRLNSWARAAAKDFANALRRNRWEWMRIDSDIVRRFPRAIRKAMWDAADQESVGRQLGVTPEHMQLAQRGLQMLTPEQRALVESEQGRAQGAWVKARDLGMVEGEGLPAYTPRAIVNMAFGEGGSMPLNSIGRNLRVSTPFLRGRKYLTAEETEAAAKARGGEAAELVRDIRVLPLATARLEDAIAGRMLINNIKEYGQRTGQDTVSEGSKPGPGWFTLDHPAFQTWRPKLEKMEEPGPLGGTMRAATDKEGNIIFERVPLYVHRDFEGPLRAVLAQNNNRIYGALMSLKGKSMSIIMYSPIIHNAVEWGRALPAMPGKVLTFRVYFDGNRAKNNPAIMREAIDAGLVPIGNRFFNQDITSIAEAPDLTPGRSWTAKVLGSVPGLFDERAGTAVKAGIDRMGDFWHNTLLWDRIGDLQMGLYTNFRDNLVQKGVDQQTAARAAAHWANRYAGALPVEAMSEAARKTANLLLFSRSFTLGNIGVMKDMLTGLPRDVMAQIERDVGSLDPKAKGYIRNLAVRKAVAVVMADMGLMYIGNSILQSAINVLSTDRTLDDEMRGYAQRAKEAFAERQENPMKLLQPLDFMEHVSSTYENEPGRRDRIRVGYLKDGTAIYARNPAGKIGEEFIGWMTGPLDMIHRKLGTIARPAWQIMANDRGFGRKIYDPGADAPEKYLRNMGLIAAHLVEAQFPVGPIAAGAEMVTHALGGQPGAPRRPVGELAKDIISGGEYTLPALQVLGPMAGVTFSKGAPGGPAVGELYAARTQHQYRVDMALPDIRKQIQRGDIAGASERMTELGIPPGLQKFYIRTGLNPATRLSGRTLRDFYLYATPEQRQRLERANGVR